MFLCMVTVGIYQSLLPIGVISLSVWDLPLRLITMLTDFGPATQSS